jgi:hypothetical protein
MDESFSPTIFLYGMALVLAVGKAFTLTIWRTLPKPRPGLRQEMLQAWKNRRLRKQAATGPVQQPRSEQAADDPLKNAQGAKGEPHATVPTPEQSSATHPGSTRVPES